MANLTDLSLEDKGFMISHPQDFPREIASLIYMNERLWSEQLENYGKLLFVKNKKFETLNMINAYLESIEGKSSHKMISSSLMNLYYLPAGTYEDIGKYFQQAAMLISAEKDMGYDEELKLARLIYKEIFFNKLNANDICIRLSDDRGFSIYGNGLPILLVDQIVSVRNEATVAYLIYLLFKVCNCLDSDIAIVTYMGAIANIYSLDGNTMNSYLTKIRNSLIDEVRILDDVASFTDYPTARELTANVISTNRDSHYKDRSIYTKNEMSVISDGIKDDTPLYFEINKLVNGRLKEYFEDDDVIEYNGFSESDIGFLTKQGFVMGKAYIHNSNWNMLTIATKDDESYLLFRLNGKPEIYGLSIKESKDEERKMIVIEVPSDPLYQLQSNNLINIG